MSLAMSVETHQRIPVIRSSHNLNFSTAKVKTVQVATKLSFVAILCLFVGNFYCYPTLKPLVAKQPSRNYTNCEAKMYRHRSKKVVANHSTSKVNTVMLHPAYPFLLRNVGGGANGKPEGALVCIVDAQSLPSSSNRCVKTSEWGTYGSPGDYASITGCNSENTDKPFENLQKKGKVLSERTETTDNDKPRTVEPMMGFNSKVNAWKDMKTLNKAAGQELFLAVDEVLTTGLDIAKLNSCNIGKGSLCGASAQKTTRAKVRAIKLSEDALLDSYLDRVMGNEPVAKMLQTFVVSRESLMSIFKKRRPDEMDNYMHIIQQFPLQELFGETEISAPDGTVYKTLLMTEPIYDSDMATVDDNDDGFDGPNTGSQQSIKTETQASSTVASDTAGSATGSGAASGIDPIDNTLDSLDSLLASDVLTKGWKEAKGSWVKLVTGLFGAVQQLRSTQNSSTSNVTHELSVPSTWADSNSVRIGRLEDQSKELDRNVHGLASTTKTLASKVVKFEGELFSAQRQLGRVQKSVDEVKNSATVSGLTSAAAMHVVEQGISEFCDRQAYQPVMAHRNGSLNQPGSPITRITEHLDSNRTIPRFESFTVAHVNIWQLSHAQVAPIFREFPRLKQMTGEQLMRLDVDMFSISFSMPKEKGTALVDAVKTESANRNQLWFKKTQRSQDLHDFNGGTQSTHSQGGNHERGRDKNGGNGSYSPSNRSSGKKKGKGKGGHLPHQNRWEENFSSPSSIKTERSTGQEATTVDRDRLQEAQRNHARRRASQHRRNELEVMLETENSQYDNGFADQAFLSDPGQFSHSTNKRNRSGDRDHDRGRSGDRDRDRNRDRDRGRRYERKSNFSSYDGGNQSDAEASSSTFPATQPSAMDQA
jgi:hypothetical protein